MISRRKMLALTAAWGSFTKAFAAVPAKPSAAALQNKLGDKLVLKGAQGYEALRQFSIFNARKPKRYPEGIVMAETVDDVIDAVKLAAARGWKIGVRSGGHSWVASHTRDGAILINLSRMQEMRIEPETMTAIVSPAVEGQVLNAELQDKHKLMFPSAHGVGVGLGGFVMCGGHGWNARQWGPGCANLKALDVVTADGRLIHADETTNSDYLWAARGSGPGFFGVAVRYYLQCHPMPPVMKRSTYVFPADVVDELVAWTRNNCNGFPKPLEVVLIGRKVDGAPQLIVSCTALGEEKEVVDALAVMESMPFLAKAKVRRVNTPVQIPFRYEPETEGQPAGSRFVVDNVWTSAPAEQLVPLMRQFFTDFPTPKSYAFWQCWGPVHKLEDMAYSVQGDVYLAANAVYGDPADDARCDAWAKGAMERLQSISLGAQMNDDNMALRPDRYLSQPAAARLEALKAKHDPHGRFVSFLRKA